jgi:quercetin dioxygenase-like cupin family protein
MAGGIQIRHARDAKELTADDGLVRSRRVVGPSRGSERVSVDLVTLAAGYEDEARYESRDEIMYLTKGEAEIEFDGVRRRLGPGSAIFVPQGAEYRWKVIGEPNELLVIFSPPS